MTAEHDINKQQHTIKTAAGILFINEVTVISTGKLKLFIIVLPFSGISVPCKHGSLQISNAYQ